MRRNRFMSEEEFQRLAASPPPRPAAQPDPDAADVDEAPAGALPDGPEPAAAPEATAPVGGTTARATKRPEPAPPVPAPVRPVPGAGSAAAAGVGGVFDIDIGPEDGGAIEIVSREMDGGIVSLSVVGNLDSSSAGDLEGVLESVYEHGYRKIIVDLGDVSYISSGGWGIFTGRVRQLREGEGDVVLVGMSPEVYDIYELLGFRDIIMHFQNADEAHHFLSLPIGERRRLFEAAMSPEGGEGTLEQRISVESPVEGESSPWTPLRIQAGTVGESGEIAVIELDGVIDTVSCMKLRTLLDELIDGGRRRIVIDMSRVEYVSSSGWGVFASRIEDVRRGDGDIKIFGMDPEVDTIFHMLGFDSIMRSFSILAEAIGDFERPAPLPVEEETAAAAQTAAAPSDGDADDTGRTRESGGEARTVDAPADGPARRREPDLRLDIEIERLRNGRIAVARATGAIDASTAEAFESRLDRFALNGNAHLVIDLEGVVYISSSGWGVIVKHLQRLGGQGRRLVLSGMTPPIFKIFRDLGFEPLVQHYLSATAAVEALDIVSLEQETEASPAGSVSGDERIGSAAAGKAGGHRTESRPTIGGTSVEPLHEKPRERVEERTVELDVARKRDMREDKDQRIREIGWGEYGKRLVDRNRKPADDEDGTS